MNPTLNDMNKAKKTFFSLYYLKAAFTFNKNFRSSRIACIPLGTLYHTKFPNRDAANRSGSRT